jgi:hypothetical protein
MKSKKIYFYKLFQIRQVVIKGTMIKFEEKINWMDVLKLEGLDMKIEKEREKKWNEMKSPLIQNWRSIGYTHCLWWQEHREDSNAVVETCFCLLWDIIHITWMTRKQSTRWCVKCMHLLFFKIIIFTCSITQLPLSQPDHNKKKNIMKIQIALELNFSNFFFKI